jgi:hypothetical protein
MDRMPPSRSPFCYFTVHFDSRIRRKHARRGPQLWQILISSAEEFPGQRFGKSDAPGASPLAADCELKRFDLADRSARILRKRIDAHFPVRNIFHFAL